MRSSAPAPSTQRTIRVIQVTLLRHLADHRLDLAEKDLRNGATLTPSDTQHETELWKAVLKKGKLTPSEKVMALNWMMAHGVPAGRAAKVGLMGHALRNQPREVWEWLAEQHSAPFRLSLIKDVDLTGWIKCAVKRSDTQAMQWLTGHQIEERISRKVGLQRLVANHIGEVLIEHGLRGVEHQRCLEAWGARVEHITQPQNYGAVAGPLLQLIKIVPDLNSPDLAPTDIRECLELFEQNWALLIQMGADPKVAGHYPSSETGKMEVMTPEEALTHASHAQAMASLHRADEAMTLSPARSRPRRQRT